METCGKNAERAATGTIESNGRWKRTPDLAAGQKKYPRPEPKNSDNRLWAYGGLNVAAGAGREIILGVGGLQCWEVLIVPVGEFDERWPRVVVRREKEGARHDDLHGFAAGIVY